MGCTIALHYLTIYMAKYIKRRSMIKMYHERYPDLIPQQEKVFHSGSCHCCRAKFRLQYSSTINAIDLPSCKLRFPRTSVPYDDFELLSDYNVLSIYAVRSVEDQVGFHAFCSYCGMQVLYVPNSERSLMEINVDCLDKSTVKQLNIALNTAHEISIPVERHLSNRRGSGCDISGDPRHLHICSSNESDAETDDLYRSFLLGNPDDSSTVLSFSSYYGQESFDNEKVMKGLNSFKATAENLDLPLYQNLKRFLTHHL